MPDLTEEPNPYPEGTMLHDWWELHRALRNLGAEIWAVRVRLLVDLAIVYFVIVAIVIGWSWTRV